jgi:2-amino-4-hydroxy-6-hydroxymethyldihydropteridine diphosphokinase
MNNAPTRIFVGLGSNMDHPIGQLRRALTSLAAVPRTEVVRTSSFYANPPMGPQDQPDFVNAVAELNSTLAPVSLLTELQCIEFRHGRRRARRWGQRCLDLDLLLYGDSRVETERLTVPHPGMTERAFVLVPLAEIAPALLLPGGASAAAHARQFSGASLTVLSA